ncbi:hypothetical protein GCM10027052_01670 [Parafrigoribacterium mesophilum]|uniref:hypothetical protein n=1 Tax=Parafrigoribacterium mesophilum TaxID=433646 RepID=UPI0031FE30E9
MDLGTINGSAAGERTARLTLTNKGSIPLVAHWGAETTGGVIGGSEAITAIPAADSTALNAGGTQDVNIGFRWDELGNADLNTNRTALYTVNCTHAGTQAYVAANHLTVSSAFIVADASASAGSTNVISCVNYSGTRLFGTGC